MFRLPSKADDDCHADRHHTQIDPRRRAPIIGVGKSASAESIESHTEEVRAEQLLEAFRAEHSFSIDRRTHERDGQEIDAFPHVHEHCDGCRENLVESHWAMLHLHSDFLESPSSPLVFLLCQARLVG